MAKRDFKKGDIVTLIESADARGTVRTTQAIVKSCGAVQMTLLDANTGAMLGRNFAPTLAAEYGLGTHPLTEGDALQALALQVAFGFLLETAGFYASLKARGIVRMDPKLHGPQILA